MLTKSDSKKSVCLFGTLIVLGGVIAILSVSTNGHAYSEGKNHKRWTSGPIASILNNKEGKPGWILSGGWVTNIINKTKDSFNQTNPAKFDSSINMVMLNGSAMYKHRISKFSLSDITNQNNMNTYRGTVAITMKDGPVKDVPVEIKVMNNHAIAISLDAARTNNHFGDTPIYGTILTKADSAVVMSQMGNRTKMGNAACVGAMAACGPICAGDPFGPACVSCLGQ
jgi:hypothetical protein